VERTRRTRAFVTCGVVTLALSGAALSAGAGLPFAVPGKTFGANLAALAPQSNMTCERLYFQATCTVFTAGASLGTTADSFLVPQGPGAKGAGVITMLRVKVGPSSGQMQILLLEALRRPPPAPQKATCCVVLRATRAFVPKADATTAIRVDWPTEADTVANPKNGIYAFDLIALSVGSAVALPAVAHAGASDGFFAPACAATPGSECLREGGDERYIVTMDADWAPAG